MGIRYQQPQIGVGLDQSNPLTQGAYAWLPSSPLLFFGKRIVAATVENAYNSSPIGDAGTSRKWTRSANAGIDFGVTQIITQNSGVTVLVVAAPTAAASMKVPFSQRVAGGNYTQTDFVFNAATIDSLGASAGTVVLTTYSGTSGGLLANSQIDGKRHCWVAGNGPSIGYIIRDGVDQTLSTSTRMSTFTAGTQKLRIGNMADDATTTYPCDDPVYLVVVWDRLLSKTDAKAVSANPWQLFRKQTNSILMKIGAGGSNSYTLTAQGGNYSITGNSANILKSKLLTSSGGSYTLNGTVVGIYKSKYFQTQGGVYSSSGSTVSILKNNLFTVQGGAYTYTGADIGITYTGSSSVYTIVAQGGSYNFNGSNATLQKSKLVTAQGGIYSFVGKNANITHTIPGSGGLVSGPYLEAISGKILYLKPI